MKRLNELRRRFPWPSKRPESSYGCHGWFPKANQAKLDSLLDDSTRIIYEAGCYQGLSSRFFADRAPNASILCNDHWLGSFEHLIHAKWQPHLSTLYETFLRNLWPYRERVIPMRTTIQDGIRLLSHFEIHPDVIYLDASHDTCSVRDDLVSILDRFPNASIVGDDFVLKTVRQGVRQALNAFPGRTISSRGHCWWIENKGQ